MIGRASPQAPDFGADAPSGAPLLSTDSEIEFGSGFVVSTNPRIGRMTQMKPK
jgi:hypothetical protein